MATITDWSNDGARAFGCPSALQDALASALQVPVNTGQGYSSIEYIAVWACRYSSDPTIAKQAYDLWPTLNSYGYYPSAAFGIAAMIVFGLSGALHLFQMYRSRRWILIAGPVMAAGLEVYGWYLRYGSSKDVMYGYVVQLAVLTIAPTFLAGGVYTLFYAFAVGENPKLMPLLRPKKFSWTIFGVEMLTLCIQAAGGALAATGNRESLFKLGTRIMTAGTSLQLATSLAFVVLFLVYFNRLRRYKSDTFSLRKGSGRIFWGTLLLELFLIIRGAYRTAELSEGLFGKLGRSQIALILGDAIPIMIASVLLNIIHPLHTVKAKPRHQTVPSQASDEEELKYVESQHV
ncbi:hypothetical protein JCM3765_007699 [Sporobolomyces pararoseus]